MLSYRPIRCALISVSDKTEILTLAQDLFRRGIKLFSTGGTARFLARSGLVITEVSDYTGFPEIMDGRLKTLHPKVHGGILGRRHKDCDVMDSHGIMPIDMVVVNLYPFSQVASCSACTLEEAIDQIDIGGLTMIRSAAKNYRDVAVVVNISDYTTISKELDQNGNSLTLKTRFYLAAKAFKYTASYDSKIANYFSNILTDSDQERMKPSEFFPSILHLNFIKKEDIRYGENSHQKAAFYIEDTNLQPCVATAQQLQGKNLSYNNIADADTALECVKEFELPSCVIVKHSNPCGVASAQTLFEAYEKAYKTDSSSAFGGVIAFNRELDLATIKSVISRQFVEVIISPSISSEALNLAVTKKNLRILICGEWKQLRHMALDFKRVKGGLLVQSQDTKIVSKNQLRVVSKRLASQRDILDSLFGWKVAKFVKSNAIVYVRNNMTLGIGAGQMSRVYSAKIASIKAAEQGLQLQGSVMASDGFIPFSDSIEVAASVGVKCVIQPGNSIRDDEVIAAVDKYNMVMIFTDIRHFRH
ncbi:bifunctional phosphoribosylaminoimidazolecarboxamide formyltransferase/IMP cyclohydrolase [Candidatus Erwinia haradaeae]|uniref:Bifunctional purine biosynthesis protein PurH n=1 Tax=Candidatus Erwinia haradaeae TaxID=1922217 RepID=A0A451D8J3_9GAMM|nr:bifunctional phosphoribosylaminoimidazolecarboxamide formyltransferase/IMP cyclohydrolase [Candidatus Erwinia haradaeae]VFP82138.1 Bifunctional purine biosynthesis protein PurH [Candidatus Erwinia haradaeae]